MTEYLFFLNYLMLTRLFFWRVASNPQSNAYWFILATQALYPLVLFQFHWSLLILVGMIWVSTQITDKVYSEAGKLAGAQCAVFIVIALTASLVFQQGIEFHEWFKKLVLFLLGVSVWTSTIALTHFIKLNSVLFGALLLTNEINLLIRYSFYKLKLEPQKASENSAELENIEQERETDQEEYNAGRVIGVLERYLIYTIILSSANNNAIAFIIAAKTFARFKQLDERHFAEYMLVGTLISTMAAILTASLVTVTFVP